MRHLFKGHESADECDLPGGCHAGVTNSHGLWDFCGRTESAPVHLAPIDAEVEKFTAALRERAHNRYDVDISDAANVFRQYLSDRKDE